MVRIAVLGCGTMGLKIAGFILLLIMYFFQFSLFLGNFAYFNHTVKMFDSDIKQLDMVCERIRHDEDELYRDGLIEVPRFPVSLINKSKSIFILVLIIYSGSNLMFKST